jgi:hypothetical protein
MIRKTPDLPVLTGPQKRSLALKAKDEHAVSHYSAMIKGSMTPAKYNRLVTPEMAEIILARVSCGDTLRAVCMELGISSANARLFFRENAGLYAEQWRMAKEDCASAMHELMFEIAGDTSIGIETRKLYLDICKWTAERFNRDTFASRQQIDHRHAVAYILPAGSDDL